MPKSEGAPKRYSFAVTRPVGILMVFLAAVVFGWLSLGKLPITLMPELSYPTLTVRTEYPGSAPEEVENDISRPIEEALGVVKGLKKISSISRAGLSDVVLEFGWDTDISDATQDVLEKIDLVFLPEEANRPLILHFDPSLDPVMELSLSGEGERFEGESGLRRLRRIGELQIKKELEPLKGVAAVRVRGGLEEEIHVELQEEALRRANLSIQTVIQRLAQENINVAGGTLQEGRTEFLVRTLNEFEDLDQIRETIVTRVDNRDIRVRDLGTVSWGHKERDIETRTEGLESVQIDIYKEGDANIVALAKMVTRTMGDFDFEAAKDPEKAVKAAPAPGQQNPMLGPQLVKSLYENEGVELRVVADRSLFIESSVKDVRNTAVFGGILAILVLALFLRNAKATTIVAVSIPISLLITFAPLNLMGVSLNIMSLGGLALGIGMLVDSSIVVLESIFRCKEEGDEIQDAADRGTSEVRGAVFASTLTSIAVFFPMVFVEGIAGQAFGDLGMAVVVSLLASAAVALYFIPMLASRRGMNFDEWRQGNFFDQMATFRSIEGLRGRFQFWLNGIKPRKLPARQAIFYPVVLGAKALMAVFGLPILMLLFGLALALEIVGKLLTLAVFIAALGIMKFVAPAARVVVGILMFVPVKVTQAILEGLRRAYPRVIRGALAAPIIVVALVAVCLWGTWSVVKTMDSELLPEVHQGEFTVEVALPVGTPLEETERVISPVEAAILEEREFIESMILTIGFDSENSNSSDEGEHSARFKVLLEEDHRGAESEQLVIDRLRDRLADVPDLESRVVRPVLFSQKTPIEIEVHGYDLRSLRQMGERVADEMSRLPTLTDVETSLRVGAPEVQIVYDRDRLSRYDLNIQQVAQLVRDKVKGNEATRFNMKDRRVPILVRLSASDRESVEDVRGININPGADRPIRLDAVAEVSLGEGPSEVRRVDGRRVALVSANLAAGSLSQATDQIRSTLRSNIEWPSEMAFFITGQNEEWQNSQRSLWIALALSVFLVYVIMAAQFESLVHPLVIMFTIPLAFVGTFLTLKVLGISLSIVVFLGMIMLAGIVVNNAIVLVDYINRLRARGLPRDEAIVEAGAVRLRPILMTTATTVLGLLPMALGLGDGAEIRTPMAIAVISGLISSTLLTLIVIPCFYMLADGAVRRLFGRPAEVASDRPSGSPTPTMAPDGSRTATT